MNILTIMGTPMRIFLGFPLIVFICVAVYQFKQVMDELKELRKLYGPTYKVTFKLIVSKMQWKYAIGFGLASLIIIALLSLAN